MPVALGTEEVDSKLTYVQDLRRGNDDVRELKSYVIDGIIMSFNLVGSFLYCRLSGISIR